ncbi:MAG: hypothetical protein CMJ83_04160 [Planctomycetes bacterium]|nr:hypothetical protein [Planctomycetota bacterium]
MTEDLRSDQQLVARILQGDDAASGSLFRRHVVQLHRFLWWRVGQDSGAAEELLQDVFFDAWEGLSRFDADAEWWPWLLGIARRRLARHHRARTTRRRGLAPADLASVVEALAGERPLPDEVLERTEVRDALAQALSTLSPRAGDLLVFKYVERQSLDEIGERLGMSSGAVSSALQRARADLRATLRRWLPEEVDHVT